MHKITDLIATGEVALDTPLSPDAGQQRAERCLAWGLLQGNDQFWVVCARSCVCQKRPLREKV